MRTTTGACTRCRGACARSADASATAVRSAARGCAGSASMEGTCTSSVVALTTAIATMKAGTAVVHAGVRLQIASTIRDGCESGADPVPLQRMVGHHKALRAVIERERNPGWPWCGAFGDKAISKLVRLHVRISRTRQRHRRRGAELLRRLPEQFDWMFVAEHDAPDGTAVFRVHRKSGCFAVHGQMVLHIVRVNRNERDSMAILDPVHTRSMMAMPGNPHVAIALVDPASGVTDSPGPCGRRLQRNRSARRNYGP